MGDFEILTLSDSKKWNYYLEQLPVDQQDIYYTPEYYRLYEDLGDGKAGCFVFQKGSDVALYLFLINSVNALGFDLDKEYYDIQGAYGYNGIVSSSYDSNFINEFYKKFNSFCLEKNIICEFSRFHPVIENHLFSNDHMDVFYNRKTIYLEINSEFDDIWRQHFDKQVRKNFNRAEKQGVLFRIANSEKEYLEFYEIYCERMKQINAESYYLFNRDFFKNLFLKLSDNLTLYLAYHDEELLGGFLLFHYSKKANNFLSAGSLSHKKYNINDYLQVVAIRGAVEKKCKWIHFGGGNSNDKNDSLLRFKSKFSKTCSDFYIGKKIHNQDVYDKVVGQWTDRYPEKTNLFKNHLLKYRY